MATAVEPAGDRDGVLSRTELRDLGLTRFDVKREVRGGRWTVRGSQAVILHTGPLDTRARWRVALLETGRHAALLVVMAVQQRLTTAGAITRELQNVSRDRRRPLLRTVLTDVQGGAQALGKLDFARLCRAYAAPAPRRQVVRLGPGWAYLDAYWEDCDLVAEIEGVHHGAGQTQVDVALRANALSWVAADGCASRCSACAPARRSSWPRLSQRGARAVAAA